MCYVHNQWYDISCATLYYWMQCVGKIQTSFNVTVGDMYSNHCVLWVLKYFQDCSWRCTSTTVELDVKSHYYNECGYTSLWNAQKYNTFSGSHVIYRYKDTVHFRKPLLHLCQWHLHMVHSFFTHDVPQ